MKHVGLIILREIGITIVVFVILAALTVVTFRKHLPYDVEVPTGEKYVQVDRKAYSVSSTDRISEVERITIVHEANQGQIVKAEDDIRIQTGKYTPFGSNNSSTDLPSERVGYAPTIPQGSNSNNGGNGSSEELQYPDVDNNDPISKIEKEQSESSESAASRRFGNSDV